jgi:hypothetical protein
LVLANKDWKKKLNSLERVYFVLCEYFSVEKVSAGNVSKG